MKPIVSVVIPAYNEEKYVSHCISSLLKQSEKRMEILMIDDGSKDRTLDILRTFESENPGKVRVFTQKNQGPGAARNLGVKEAKGEIIVLVDADMRFDENYIKDLTQPIIDGKSRGTYHVIEKIANLNNIWARAWRPRNWRETDWKNSEKSTIFRALKREDFLTAGGFNPKKGYFDDVGLADKIGMAEPTPAICYHYNPSSLSEIFNQMVWIGSSFPKNKKKMRQYVVRMRKPFFSCLIILIVSLLLCLITKIYFISMIISVIVALILLVTIYRTITDRYLTHLFAIPLFYAAKSSGFLVGIIKGITKK